MKTRKEKNIFLPYVYRKIIKNEKIKRLLNVYQEWIIRIYKQKQRKVFMKNLFEINKKY